MTPPIKNLRVGIVGASPGKSWASRSHIPAIAAVEGLTLTAVATSRPETARAAAEQFGAAHAFVGAEGMAASAEVDLVIVAVKVPAHRAVVRAALEAGKHVYCEWPLGVDRTEAEQMAAQAERAAGRHAVGLQARSSPTLRYLRDLIDAGYIGDVESCSVTAYSQRGADPVTSAKRYLFEKTSGANLLTIETGHLLDAVCFLLGEPDTVRSHAALRRGLLPDAGGTLFSPDTADTLTAAMLTGTGAPVSLHLAQGTHGLFTTELSIVGSGGALRLNTTAPGGIQMAPLELLGTKSKTTALEKLPVPASYNSTADSGPPTALNVAEALNAFVSDIQNGTRTIPDFDHAVQRHRTLEQMLASPLFAPRETTLVPAAARP